MRRLWRRIQHAFAIRRRTLKRAQEVPLVQWSQWRSAAERRREVEEVHRSVVTIRCARCRNPMRDVPRDGDCPTCGFAVRQTIQAAGRVPWLFAISILGMGGLGALAILALMVGEMVMVPLAQVDGGEILFEIIVLVPLCFIIGSIVGMFSAPIVIPALCRRDLRYAVPLVYGGSAIVTLLYLFLPMNHPVYFPLDSAVPAYVSVCVLSLIAALLCPRFDVPRFGLCEQCNYDLRGNTSGVCPECGAATSPTRKRGSEARDHAGAVVED